MIAGFLLTAVPNWTGRLSIVGWPLGILFALWIAGRIRGCSGLAPWGDAQSEVWHRSMRIC
ncbi:hypothetical protein AN191_03470 [Loktanella sp. 5RATIMAR09]|nr:NnrS family protein [Loktanella sp. 5RATIMAR09]KQI72976.1 hypothetical protein AN191_03470 [Loktanella sp. 5RATIMAR09]